MIPDRRNFAAVLILVWLGAFAVCSSAVPPKSSPSKATPKAAAPAKATPAPEPKVRIVDWNLRWFPGGKPDATPEQAAAQMAAARDAMKELKPDILLLQEVNDWKATEQLCAVIPGLQVQVVSRFEPRPQNQVIASKFPADSAWSEVWKVGALEPPRGYSFTAIKLPGNRTLLTYSLHLKSNLGELPTNISLRQEAARQLLLHAREMLSLYGRRGRCAVVVGGDMNTSLDDPRFEKDQALRAWLAAGFYWTHQGVRFPQRITIPAEGQFPDGCFDHIFTLGLGKQTASVKAYPGISDHNPVILDVDLQKADWAPKLDLAAGLTLVKAKPTFTSPIAGTLSANDHEGIKAAAGKIVAISGKVANVGQTPTGTVSFINFEGNERGKFVAIVKKSNHDAVVAALGSDLKTALVGKNVQVRGEVTIFKETPEIVIADGRQITILK